MEILGKIRRLYLRDKLSLHEITKRTGLSRNTIRRWLRSPRGAVPPRYRRREGLVKLTAFCEAVELVIESGALSAEHVLNVLARLTASTPPACVETSLQLKEVPLANTGRYDSLRSPDEVTVDASVDAKEIDHA